MLINDIERAEKNQSGGVVTGYGSCRFCGQQEARKVLEDWTQEEKDELVTETCECLEARLYAAEKGQKERAHKRIEMLFGENNGVVTCNAAVLELLHSIINPVCEGNIAAATVDIGNGVKAKINITNKGNIKVGRTKTDTSTYEA